MTKLNEYTTKYGYRTLQTMLEDHFENHPSEDILVKEIIDNAKELKEALREYLNQQNQP